MEQAEPPILLSRRAVSGRLGQLYRQARILRRLLRLLEEADRQHLPLFIADHLPTRDANRTEGHACE
jgi:hypothetical protein